jgi:hypothetical protein
MVQQNDDDRDSLGAVSNPHGFEAWFDIMRTTDLFLRAGLRMRIGPEGDLEEAYRQWYADHMREHDDALRQLVHNLHRPDEGSENAR